MSIIFSTLKNTPVKLSMNDFKSFCSFLLKSISFIYQNLLTSKKNHSKTRETLVIYVSPWETTYIPLFSFKLGLCLENYFNVQYLINDIAVGPHHISQRFYATVLKFVSLFLKSETIYLSQVPKSESIDLDQCKTLANLNTIHFLKYEEKDNLFLKTHELFLKDLVVSSGHLKTFFKRNFTKVIIPGGICQDTGLFFKYADNKQVITFDSGKANIFQISVSGVASQQPDIGLILRKESFSETDISWMKAKAKEEIRKRTEGRSTFSYQPKHTNLLLKKRIKRILIPLNVCWDSAALGNFTFFKDSLEWLKETITYVKHNHPDTEVIIRRHPAEKNDDSRSKTNYQKFFSEHDLLSENIIFVDYNDHYSSYDILKDSNLVICQSSTFGIEASCSDKNVICVSSCYYSDLQFVHSPKNQEQYYDLINNLLTKNDSISTTALDHAYLSYYFSQCCNWFFTDFHPGLNFDFWNKEECENLVANKDFKFIFNGIINNVPPALLKHQDNKTKGYI